MKYYVHTQERNILKYLLVTFCSSNHYINVIVPVNGSHVTIFSRFDLLIGFNGQEGGISYSTLVQILADLTGHNITNGTSILFITQVVLPFYCAQQAPQSVELCLYFIRDHYQFNDAGDDRERAHMLIEFLGKIGGDQIFH